MSIPLLVRFVTLRNVHPILAHISNGLTPAAFLFTLLSGLFHYPCLLESSYYMMLLVAFTTPITMVTGLVDWKYRYDLRSTPVIKKKVISSIIGYGFVVAYVSTKSVFALAIAFLLFAITGEYGGRLVHEVANQALIRKFKG